MKTLTHVAGNSSIHNAPLRRLFFPIGDPTLNISIRNANSVKHDSHVTKDSVNLWRQYEWTAFPLLNLKWFILHGKYFMKYEIKNCSFWLEVARHFGLLRGTRYKGRNSAVQSRQLSWTVQYKKCVQYNRLQVDSSLQWFQVLSINFFI